MSQRDDLLAGAKACLLQLGYARTTARDITAASGANLSSIGYHFGSKDELMLQAMVALMTDWGAFPQAVAVGGENQPVDQFERGWASVIEMMRTDSTVAAANFEAFAQLPRSARLRATVAEVYQAAREKMVDDYLPSADRFDARQRQAIGSVLLALVPGLMAQWLVDPEHAPDASDLTMALQLIGAALSGKAPDQ